MSETIKSTYGVFNQIIKSSTHGTFDDFANELVAIPSNELTSFIEEYKNRIKKSRSELITLAKLENIIIQLRSKNLQPSDIKLSFVRDYIYARTFFYREGKKSHDIRVLVGLKTIYGDNIHTLANDKDFMAIAIEKLTPAINAEINKSLSHYYEHLKKDEVTV